MVKVDKCLILHLAVAAIASTVKSIILCTQLDLVFGAVLANGDSTSAAIVMR